MGKLPKKIKVGERWYSVEVVETMQRKPMMGYVYYGTGAIEIANGIETSYPGFGEILLALGGDVEPTSSAIR